MDSELDVYNRAVAKLTDSVVALESFHKRKQIAETKGLPEHIMVDFMAEEARLIRRIRKRCTEALWCLPRDVGGE